VNIKPVVEKQMEIFFFLRIDFNCQIRIFVEITDFDFVTDKTARQRTSVVMNLSNEFR